MSGIETKITIDGEGEKKTVQWSRNDTELSVSLAELIDSAVQEFPGIPLDDLRVFDKIDFDQYNTHGESSEVFLCHKDG